MRNACCFKKKLYVCSVLKLSAGVMTCHPLRRQVFLYTYHRHVIAVSHPRRLRLMPGQSRKSLEQRVRRCRFFSSPVMF
ncbi:TPA_asm: hypothetical protein [Porphyromonas phage phage022a_WW2931]|uniref:Secreted protein n=1 Tax=Porphyromonas phage phage022a_WW2931 TaxID=3154112 RepID=A0AAT9J8R6_9CAUD